MNEKFIEKIQKRIIDLLLTLSDNLETAPKDQCSEVARLVGCWILEELPACEVRILKGTFFNGLAHDVLVVEDGKLLFLIDPTVWQFFPKSDSVNIGLVHTTAEAVDLLQKKYGGEWDVSETMGVCDASYQEQLLSIIKDIG